jgi:hypothetical protein
MNSDTYTVNNLLLDYIKEKTDGLSKMCINRIRRASIEKDEWDALQAFEDVASAQQKIYAKSFLKPALRSFHKKKKNYDLIGAHILNDIVPKILPQYDFNLPVDVTSLSSEQTQENKESIHQLSKEFRLKATELYLKIAKDELDFQEERLQQLLEDFPRDKPSLTGLVTDGIDLEPDDNDTDDNVYTRIPSSQIPRTQMIRSVVSLQGSELFSKYKSIALDRVLLEIEREIHFLAERGVEETPFELQDIKDMNPVLRKDFMLQAF